MYEVEMRPTSGRQILALLSFGSCQSSKSNYLAVIGLVLASFSSFGLSGCGGVVFTPGSSGTNASGAVNLVATPTAVEFGTVSVGNSANQKVTIANVGSGAVQIADLSVSNPAFRVDGEGKLPVSLAAGSSLSINVHFIPKDSSDITDQLSVTVGTSTTAALKVRLHGKGTGAAQTAEISGLNCENLELTGPGADACSVVTSAAAPSGGLLVQLKSSLSAIKVPASVTVPEGEESVKFSATVSSVTTNQTATITATQGSNVKSLSISLSPPAAAGSTPGLSGLSCAASSFTGAGKTTCTVSLNEAASKALSIALASSNSAVSVPAATTVSAGSTTASFSANVIAVSKAETVTVSATADGSSKSVEIQLKTSKASVPGLGLSVSSLAFGNVSLGTSVSKSVTLTSNGTAPVTIKSDSITGSGFSLSGGHFPATLPPGQQMVVTVQFDPAAAGAASGTLEISSDAAGVSVALSGTGTTTAPTISGISCHSTSITGSLADPCTVTLSGSAPRGGLTVALGSSSTNVTVPGAVTVPAAASSATFTADAAAVSIAQAVKLTATTGAISKSVSLQLDPALAQLSVNATKISFGPIVVNLPTIQLVTLTSTGKAAVTVDSVSVTGSGFTLAAVKVPAVLNPGQTLLLTLTFEPATTGSKTGALTITSDSTVSPTITIPLSGAGDPHQVNLSWNAPVDSSAPVSNYKVYRAAAGSGAFQKLAVTGQTNYTDTNVQSGLSYAYYVTSLDPAGVESVPSNTTTVTVP